MRKATTAAMALVCLLVLAVVPVLAANEQQTQPEQKQGETVKSGEATVPESENGEQAAKPADQEKKQAEPGEQPAKTAESGEQAAKPADQAKPPEQPKPAPKPNPNALTRNSYGGGFRLGTDDGRFLMRIFAATQFRYTYMTFDDRVSGNELDYSNFFMRRARLWWDGHAYSPKFTYYFHVQLEPSSAVNLHDAWINYAFHPMFQIGSGRNKIAYGLEFLHSGFGLNLVERSVMYGETDINAGGGFSRFPGGGTQGFGLSGEQANTGFPVGGLCLFRSQGIQVSGRNGDKGSVFEYQAGIWQGRNTRGASNQANNHIYVARAGFYPNGWINWLFEGDHANSPSMKVGVLGSVYSRKQYLTRNAAGVAVPRYEGRDSGFNLAGMLRYRGFSADLEYGNESYEMTDPNLVGPSEFDRGGWRAQLGYFVQPATVEVVGRYAEIQRLKDPTVQAVRNTGLGFATIDGRPAVEDKIREVTFGVNYYLSGAQHQHKLFFDVSRLNRDFAGFVEGNNLVGGTPTQGDTRFRAMLQFKF
jgi:hypothetical protein